MGEHKRLYCLELLYLMTILEYCVRLRGDWTVDSQVAAIKQSEGITMLPNVVGPKGCCFQNRNILGHCMSSTGQLYRNCT